MNDKFNDPKKNNLFSDFDQRTYELWKKGTDRIFLQPVVDLVFSAFDAFAESEIQRKYVVRAEVLNLPDVEQYRWDYSKALNYRGIGRLEKAVKAIDHAVTQCQANPEEINPLERYVKSKEFAEFLNFNIFPDLKFKLLNSTYTPGEVKVFADELLAENKWGQSLSGIYDELKTAVEDLKKLRSSENSGNQIDTETGVAIWKQIGIKIVSILVRAIIAYVCADIPIPIIDTIACLILEAVWGMVEKKIEEKVMGWCRDGKPSKPRRVG